MPNATVQARISSELKKESEAVFTAIGLTTAEAIRLFLQQTVNSGGLPFQPTAKMPNAETLSAMNEIEDNGGTVFSSPDELFADWNN